MTERARSRLIFSRSLSFSLSLRAAVSFYLQLIFASFTLPSSPWIFILLLTPLNVNSSFPGLFLFISVAWWFDHAENTRLAITRRPSIPPQGHLLSQMLLFVHFNPSFAGKLQAWFGFSSQIPSIIRLVLGRRRLFVVFIYWDNKVTLSLSWEGIVSSWLDSTRLLCVAGADEVVCPRGAFNSLISAGYVIFRWDHHLLLTFGPTGCVERQSFSLRLCFNP